MALQCQLGSRSVLVRFWCISFQSTVVASNLRSVHVVPRNLIEVDETDAGEQVGIAVVSVFSSYVCFSLCALFAATNCACRWLIQVS